jgi:hypothetical protein
MSNKQSIRDFYQKELEKMFSDADFARYFGPNKVIKYSELAEYPTINHLLPNDKDFRIILVESQYNSGHWTAVLKYGDIIEWFNSYGTKPEHDFKFISNIKKHLLGQGGNLLSKLLKTKNKEQKIYYNKKKLQKIADGVNTCGRHVIARILAMLVGYELDDYIQKVEQKKQETGKPADILVIDWVK